MLVVILTLLKKGNVSIKANQPKKNNVEDIKANSSSRNREYCRPNIRYLTGQIAINKKKGEV
jgi:hypothetical protein